MGGEAVAGVAEEAATVVFCLDHWHPVVLVHLPVIYKLTHAATGPSKAARF